MLPHTANNLPAESPERQERLHTLRQRLQPLLEQTADDMARELVDLADEQLFGAIEFSLRKHAHQLAANAHQVAIDARQKKTAITDPASSASPATRTPSSSTT
jgi:hypothetical protein